jgi:integrase
MTGEVGIFKRGKVWWVAYYRNGKQTLESAETTSEEAAARYLQSRLKYAEGRVTFEDLANLVITDYEARDLRTVKDLKGRFNHLRAAFSDHKAVEITTARLRLYSAERKHDGARNASINRELGAIKRGFKLALQHGMLSVTPYVAMLPETNVRSGFVGHHQFLAIANQLPSDDLRDVTEFLYLTGWRLNEALTLEWRDIDGNTLQLRAERSRTAKGRAIIMGARLGALIMVRKTKRRLDSRRVFHSAGKPMLRTSVSRSWRKAAVRAGLAGIVVDDLRRTAARNLVRAGVPERVAMILLGLRTLSMFDRYSVASDTDEACAQ